MAVTFLHKRSIVVGVTPTAEKLTPGEIAVNLAEKKWFTKTTSNEVACLNFLTALDGGEITISSAITRKLQTEARDNLVTHSGDYITGDVILPTLDSRLQTHDGDNLVTHDGDYVATE